MQCPDCNQLYKTEQWDKYQTCYAVKTGSQDAWRSLDTEALIKELIVLRAGGLLPEFCLQSGCDQQQVRGRAYCVYHLYLTGVRA